MYTSMYMHMTGQLYNRTSRSFSLMRLTGSLNNEQCMVPCKSVIAKNQSCFQYTGFAQAWIKVEGLFVSENAALFVFGRMPMVFTCLMASLAYRCIKTE